MKDRLLLEADNQVEFVVMSWSQELTLVQGRAALTQL